MGVFGSLTRRTGLGARATVGTTGFTRGKISMSQGKGRLTPKMTPRGWNKGVGCRSLGFHTKKGTAPPPLLFAPSRTVLLQFFLIMPPLRAILISSPIYVHPSMICRWLQNRAC
jgi:hypothetical protein